MAENHVLLETVELTQAASTIVFDNLPSSGYTDLKIIASARATDTTSNKWVAGYLNFNGLSTNLTSINIAARLTGVAPFADSNIAYCFWLSGSDATANSYGVTEITIPNYLSTTQNKSYSSDWAEANESTTLQILGVSGGKWASTAAITSITLISQSGNIAAGSTFSLYGIAKSGTTPTFGPKATGGNIVANDGTYWYHAFLTSGTFTPQTALTCDYLVVAGGGAGGWGSGGGGGGAGGLLASNASFASSNNYSIAIGAGATAIGNTVAAPGNNGSNSVLSGTGVSATAIGGGGGGSEATPTSNSNGVAGGSGGGACYRSGNNTGGAGTSGQGNAGGNGYTNGTHYNGGGGGGSGSAGSNGSSSNGTGGTGGAGINTYSTWHTATNTGVSGYIAGGGGGGGQSGSSGTAGSAGSGGAGSGGAYNGVAPTSGIMNTGSGGGGGAFYGSNNADARGGNGGSGVVIIRYAMA